MIIDNIKNAEKYFMLGERIKQAFLFLKEKSFETMNDGRYEIKDDEIFAIVSRYETKPVEKGVFESHKKYIDVQFVAGGMEKIGYSHVDGLKVSREYANDKDIMFYGGNGDLVTAAEGTFAVFFPEDGHMPGINAGNNAQNVLKVVVKVIAD